MTTFLLNQQTVTLSETDADRTLLDYLRLDARLTGTKEGCASGDCGACTVVVAELHQGAIRYQSLNSCITFVHSLHGKQVITVEHLAQGDQLHPVQTAMVKHHGSQCGFCTPGFIMSLFALYHSGASASRESVVQALSGNLCRCTGYRPIIDAGIEALNQVAPDAFDESAEQTLSQLSQIETEVLPKHSFSDRTVGFWQPQNRAELSSVLTEHPQARLSAGSTDLGLEKTQQLKTLTQLIDVTRVAELKQIQQDEDWLNIGAAVTYSELAEPLLADYPEAREWLERLGSAPIRNRGTLGGNLGTASPIGDGPPLLLALSAELTLGSKQGLRRMPLQGFFTGYRQTQRSETEWIDTLHIPRRKPGSLFRIYKISKRFEDDISTVCAAFYLELDDHKVTTFRAAFGGLAATPLMLPDWQASLIGHYWPELDIDTQADALQTLLNPIDDVRASAAYRCLVTANLLHRFYLESLSATNIRAAQGESSHA